MKLIKYLFVCSLMIMLAVSCYKGIDDIIPVAPGPDVSGPELVINYPVDGKPIVSPDEPASIAFKLVASDDIELKSVTLELDGATIASFTSFLDYRRLDLNYNYNLSAGNHTLVVTATDLLDQSITRSVNFSKITAPVYEPLDGEVLYFPLDGYYLDLISGSALSIVGTPGFAAGKVNDAYAGATDAYLTYPTTGVLGSEFSLSFWYKINAVPDRAGIVAISPPTDATTQDRKSGLRLFRETDGTNQKIGLNIGIGDVDVWMNPFTTVPPDQDWMHIAISISTTHASIYVDGASVNETDLAAGISWTNCSSITIASGMPNFIYWLHYSDLSLYDEMHFFNRAITAAEVQSLYQVKK
jgi:hypothetical protein